MKLRRHPDPGISLPQKLDMFEVPFGRGIYPTADIEPLDQYGALKRAGWPVS